ncbi:hypothetical protein KVV02_006064 [Mortierella alpina]|uniref:IPT/TIG domain-containing protein n=1 Tax=Mortierella alpina TaxID=64518 RepID=A0A9P8A412_MORAP|nr:hypothetical protein KVV02_006064 [Mortierella alpina]
MNHQTYCATTTPSSSVQSSNILSSAPYNNNNINIKHNNSGASYNTTTAILTSQSGASENSPMALSIGPDGAMMPLMPRWNSYDLNGLPPSQQHLVQPAKPIENMPQAEFNAQQLLQRQYCTQPQGLQGPPVQESSNLQQSAQQVYQQQQQRQQQQQQQQQHPHDIFANDYLFDAPSPVPTMSSLDIGLAGAAPQQLHASPSPLHIPEYGQSSCSPDMPIKTSPVDQSITWAPWGDSAVHTDDQAVYATPAHTHTSFDEGSRDDADFNGTKHLKVFTSSKKDDDGEFRKGQQFYLNVQLKEEDRERFRFLRIPSENIVLPCRADSTGRIGLNASGKRGAEMMSAPTSAQEEDVLSLKLTTFLEPEHRAVVPCGRCKDKTPEILRFHPGVNGKPMIDENGMVTLRNGHVKLIASAWCASTSHHRGPGTKFSFEIELTSMAHLNGHAEPLLVYQGRSDEVEIYASHGRDKGTRTASKAEKMSKSQSPPLHESGSAGGPPSPAKTSSPPGSPSSASAAHTFDMGPVKKRREEPPMTPPMIDLDLPPVIKSLEPRSGPICQENHVIIIGQNFSRGMTPMFGREYGKVIDINPFYIECTTPRYPRTETVRLWIHHNENFLPSDKTYEFTNEQAQSELEQMLRNMIQSDGEAGDAGSYFSMLGRITGLPSSADISGQSQANGSTMLHNSVLLGYQAGVELLIEEGIELDLEDDSGLTALDYAIHTNNVEITSALLYAGSIISNDHLNMLPLHPTKAMVSLLKDVCGVDLPHDTTSAGVDEVPDVTEDADVEISSPVREIDTVPSDLVQDVIAEDVEPVEPTEPESHQDPHTTMRASEEPSFATVPQSSPASPAHVAPVSRATMPSRSSRPMSIATVSTQSTGMMSMAPTLSTMAPSANSSLQSRSSHSTMAGHPRTVNHNTKGGQENIWQCAKKGNLALVKYHLDKEPSLINAPWKFDGRSVLSSACASSQPQELVEFLVQRGALVNSADSFYKRTALHVLCEEAGLSQDDWRLVVPQIEREANERDVLAAMRFMLDHGAVVDAKNHWKETALMRLFAGRDCPLMVQELYNRGADSRLKSSKDVYPHGTALAYAAFFGRINSLRWMVENDLLLNDEASIKDAIRWAKSSKGESSSSSSFGGSQASMIQSVSFVRRKEERKQEAIRLLESWLGETGQAKRKALAKQIVAEQGEGWWRRMSGIVEDAAHKAGEGDAAGDHGAALSRMPAEMKPLWKDVQTLSGNLASSSDQASSSSNRTKWNPLTMLRKGT